MTEENNKNKRLITEENNEERSIKKRKVMKNYVGAIEPLLNYLYPREVFILLKLSKTLFQNITNNNFLWINLIKIRELQLYNEKRFLFLNEQVDTIKNEYSG